MAGATRFQGSDMSPIIRRLRRLEDRFGTVETEHTRQLLAQLEAGRRRVAEWGAREGLPPKEPWPTTASSQRRGTWHPAVFSLCSSRGNSRDCLVLISPCCLPGWCD